MAKPKIQGIDQARIEREVDEDQDQGIFRAELPVDTAAGQGGEVQDEVESRAEPPASERGYRNLNE